MEQANSRGRFKLQQALASEECSGAPVFPPLSDHGDWRGGSDGDLHGV